MILMGTSVCDVGRMRSDGAKRGRVERRRDKSQLPAQLPGRRILPLLRRRPRRQTESGEGQTPLRRLQFADRERQVNLPIQNSLSEASKWRVDSRVGSGRIGSKILEICFRLLFSNCCCFFL